ncbi:MAG: extracellular solute-binding protein [Candidatus Moduliflexus flocculans]|nr:extracellular solute-binding protein [Candidatus Moduliflexus flocculans]
MRKLIAILLAVVLVGTASAQAKEIRVLLANHPYGDLLKTVIAEYEAATGVKVNVESLQESQLTTKLTTEFATNSSIGGRLHDPSSAGREDVLQERLVRAPGRLRLLRLSRRTPWASPRFGAKPYLVPLVTEWQVLYYRKDLLAERRAQGARRPSRSSRPPPRSSTPRTWRASPPAASGAAAVTQLSSYVYNYGGRYLDKGKAVFDSKAALDAHPVLRQDARPTTAPRA